MIMRKILSFDLSGYAIQVGRVLRYIVSMKKADCTPEEWEAYLAQAHQYYWRDIEKTRQRAREYHQRPEVKARRKKRTDSPEAAERRKAANASPEGKQRAKRQYQKERNDPVQWAKRIDRQRQRRTGLGNAEITALIAIQNNQCGVCGFTFADMKDVRADHCHDAKHPRGLLCHACNIMEGMIRRTGISPEEFGARLSHYLEHPPALSLNR
jgi:hypothetical protein